MLKLSRHLCWKMNFHNQNHLIKIMNFEFHFNPPNALKHLLLSFYFNHQLDFKQRRSFLEVHDCIW